MALFVAFHSTELYVCIYSICEWACHLSLSVQQAPSDLKRKVLSRMLRLLKALMAIFSLMH